MFRVYAFSWRICRCRPLYSSCFATRSARTQGTGRRRKKRAYTRPNRGLKLAEQEPIWAQPNLGLRRAQASWLQLRPSLSPTVVQHGAIWARLDAGLSMRNLGCCVGASGAEAGPKTSPCEQHGFARTRPKPETLEIAVRMTLLSLPP